MVFGLGRQERALADLVQEVRALNAAVREQSARLASIEASIGSSSTKARPPVTTKAHTPPTTTRGYSAIRTAAEPVAQSKPSGADDFVQLLLPSWQLTPVHTIELDDGERIGAVAISSSLLRLTTSDQPLAGPKFVGVAGTNGSLLLLDASGRPLAPPLQLQAPAAALAFSTTEPARLWVALQLEAGAFFLHTYAVRPTRPAPSAQRNWKAEWAEEPFPFRLTPEHQTRLWWGGADDIPRRDADTADSADAATAAAASAAAGAAPPGGVPGAAPTPAVTADASEPPAGIVALLPSFMGAGQGTGQQPSASRASVLVARSDGLVSVADASGRSASLPTGLTSMRAVARSARSLALASADRILVLELAQPGSPALARECSLPQSAVGRISDVAFDAHIPSLLYASTTDGDLLFIRTRAPAAAQAPGGARTRRYECQWAETRRAAAASPPAPPPPPPKTKSSWLAGDRRGTHGAAGGEPPPAHAARPRPGAAPCPEVAISCIPGYVLIARSGRLGAINVSDVYFGADFAAAPIVHEQVIGGLSPSLLRAAGSLVLLAHSSHPSDGDDGSPSVATLFRTSLTYEPPPRPWWLHLLFAGGIVAVTILYQWRRGGKREKGNDSDGQDSKRSGGLTARHDRAGRHGRDAQPRYAGAPRPPGAMLLAGTGTPGPFEDFRDNRFD